MDQDQCDNNASAEDAQSSRKHLSEIRHENLSSMFIESKEKNDKKQDIAILEKAVQCITDYESSQSNLRDTLIAIGDLFGKIAYNDNGDKNSVYIRNQYGYIRRNQNKSINKYGIYFESFHNFKTIFTNNQINSSISDEEWHDLENILSYLKKKINHILMEQKLSIHQQSYITESNIDFSNKSINDNFITQLTEFSRKYFKPIILLRIVDEFQHMDSIDFSSKDDRYYFARVFCIVGELFNEYLETQNNKNNNQIVFKALKQFVKLRDLLVHNHKKINVGLDNENQSISEIIVEIKEHLKQVILKSVGTEMQWIINTSYIHAMKFNDVMCRLLTSLCVKSKTKTQPQKNDPKVNEKDKIMKKLNRLMSRACGIIEGTKSQVQSKVKGIIIKLSIEDQLKILNDEYQQFLFKLEGKDKNNYPLSLGPTNEIDTKMCNISTVQNSVQSSDSDKRKIVKFFMKVQSIKEEIEYLMDLKKDWSNEETKSHSKKEKYIIQYTVAVIGQLARDIESLDICKCSGKSPSIEYLSAVNKFRSSVLMTECKITSKDLRNRGLAHDIWSFEEDRFFEGIREIESGYGVFNCFYHIFKKDIKESFSILCMIGNCFFQIGLYKESIEYYEKAFVRFDQYPCEMEISDDMDSECLEIFQMKTVFLVIHNDLIRAYQLVGLSGKALDLCKSIINKTDFNKMTSFWSNLIDYPLYLVVKNIQELGSDHQIIGQIMTLSSRCDNICFKYWLSACLVDNKNYSESKEEIRKIWYDSPKNKNLNSLEAYIVLCLMSAENENQNIEIVNCISAMETLLEENLRYYKSILGDDYIFKKTNIIYFKLRISLNYINKNIDQSELQETEIDKLRELSHQFKEINSKYRGALENHSNMGFIHFHFFIAFFVVHVKDKNWSVENLEQAHHYYDLALETIDRLPKLSHLKRDMDEIGQRFCKQFTVFGVINEVYMEYIDIDVLVGILCSPENQEMLSIFGIEFHCAGVKLLTKYIECGDEELLDSALNCFDISISYCKVQEQCSIDYLTTHLEHLSLLSRLGIIDIKMRWIKVSNILHVTMFQENEITKIRDLSNQLKAIVSALGDHLQNCSVIINLYYKFFLAFFCSLTRDNLSNWSGVNRKDAQYYFDLIVETFEKFPQQNFVLVRDLMIFEEILHSVNIDSVSFVESLIRKARIDYLMANLSTREQYKLYEDNALISLGEEFHILGEKYFEEYFNDKRVEIVTLAVNIYDNAIKYYLLQLKYIHQMKESSNDAVVDVNVKLVKCRCSIPVLKYDMVSYMWCIAYCDEVLRFPLKLTDRICVVECREVNDDIFTQLTTVLNKIAAIHSGNNQVEFHDEYISRYLSMKFDIEIINENNLKKWIYRGTLEIDELRNKIKKDIEDSYSLWNSMI